MELIVSMIFAIALATIANVTVITNTITFAFSLVAIATAKPQNISYYGAASKGIGDGCDLTLICYAVTDGGDYRQGYFYGCQTSPPLGDGLFAFDLFHYTDENFAAFWEDPVDLFGSLDYPDIHASVTFHGNLSDPDFPGARWVKGNGPPRYDFDDRIYGIPSCKGLRGGRDSSCSD